MPPPFRFQPRVEALSGPAGELELAELATRLPDGPLVLLDGWPAGTGVLGFAPLPGRPPRGLGGLRRFAASLAPGPGDAVPGAFQGGFLGALAYELGAAVERGLRLPPDPWGLPSMVGGLFTDFLVRDARAGTTWLVLGEEPGDGRAGVRERADALRAALARPRVLEPLRPLAPARRLGTRAEHARRIARARELIGAGEIYQANLSYRIERDVAGDPLELYLRLRRLHPAPRAGFARFARLALLSASPELLLTFEHDAEGSLARTRPIKGTAPRGSDEATDRANAAALLASAKDRSELAMIVDLERNDLGRIARAGSVRVEAFPSLESYASVHHLMATVEARPREGVDALESLAALFPGGSVTGAPKLRSMEVIAELEGEGRGFAYGSLLALDTRGRLEASLLIRTLIWRPRGRRRGAAQAGQVTFRVGGGITWGSEPAAEEAEAEAKGVLLARALEGADAPAVEASATGAGSAGAGRLWRAGAPDALL